VAVGDMRRIYQSGKLGMNLLLMKIPMRSL